MPHKKVQTKTARHKAQSSNVKNGNAKAAKQLARKTSKHLRDDAAGGKAKAHAKDGSAKISAPVKKRSKKVISSKKANANKKVVKSVPKVKKTKNKKEKVKSNSKKLKLGKHAKVALILPGIQSKQQSKSTRTTTAGSPSKGSLSMNSPARQNSKGSKGISPSSTKSTNPRSSKAPWFLKKKSNKKQLAQKKALKKGKTKVTTQKVKNTAGQKKRSAPLQKTPAKIREKRKKMKVVLTPSPRVRDPQVEKGHMIHELIRVKNEQSSAIRSDDICVEFMDPMMTMKPEATDTSESRVRRRLVQIKPSLAKAKNTSQSGGHSPTRVVNLVDLKQFTEKYPSPFHDERDISRTLRRMSTDELPI